MGVKRDISVFARKAGSWLIICVKLHDRIAFFNAKTAKNLGLLPSTMHIVKKLIYALGGL